MGKTIKEICEIAAKWWGEKIAKPKFDNGDNSKSSVLAGAFAAMTTKRIDDVAKEKFISKLSEIIEERLNSNRYNELTLSVDYNPCEILRKVTEDVGISINNFSWKTNMWITKDCIQTSCAGEHQVLYGNKAYWRKQIEWELKNIDENKRDDAFSWIKDESKRKKKVNEIILELEESIKEDKIQLENAEE